MLVIGWLFTALWLAGLIAVVVFNSDSATGLNLNEWGDFLAGACAPLAFFWLVLGYFQQGKELKLSREALMLQVKEFSNFVDQQRLLLAATKEDVELNKRDLKIRYETEKFRAQPIIYIHEQSVYDGREMSIHSVDLINTGHSILHVKIVFPSEFSTTSESYWDRWDYQKTKTLRMERDDPLKVGQTFQVNLTFQDGLTEHSNKTLYFSVMINGNLKLATEISPEDHF